MTIWFRYPGRGARERRMRRWHVLKSLSQASRDAACGLAVWSGITVEEADDAPVGEICQLCAAWAKRRHST